MKTGKQKFIERRKLEIFNVMTSLYILHGHRGHFVKQLSIDMVMQNIDALCGFTPAQSVQARDMIFDASENGVIPEWTMRHIATCIMKLSEILPNYQALESQDHDLWMALYNLFEVECLFEKANPAKPDDAAIEDGKADGYE